MQRANPFGEPSCNAEKIQRRNKMSNDRDDDELAAMMAMFGASVGSKGGGNFFPGSDADDFAKGVTYVPVEVTTARRSGQKVSLVQECRNKGCWYWKWPDGTQIHYFDRSTYLEIARANSKWNGEGGFKGESGPCPQCGNTYTRGETHK